MGKRRRRREPFAINPWPSIVDAVSITAFIFIILTIVLTYRLYQDSSLLKILKVHEIASSDDLDARLASAEKYDSEQKLKDIDAELARQFAGILREGGASEVTVTGSKVVITLPSDLTFPKDSDLLRDRAAVEIIRQFGNEMISRGEWLDKIAYIDVEGHTDTRQPKIGGVASDAYNNWDLSSKRAISIVKLLVRECNVPGHKLRTAGRAEFDLKNRRDQHGAQNRRVEIIIEFAEHGYGRD